MFFCLFVHFFKTGVYTKTIRPDDQDGGRDTAGWFEVCAPVIWLIHLGKIMSEHVRIFTVRFIYVSYIYLY